MVKRKLCAYLAISLIIVWSIGTYYMAIYKTSTFGKSDSNPASGPSLTNKAREIEARLADLEEAIKEQSKSNDRLLQYIRDKGKVLHPSAEQLVRPTPSQDPSVEERLGSAIVVLVIACNRPKAITRHLEKLIKLRPSSSMFPIVVSQDCAHEETRKAIEQFSNHVTLIQHPDQSPIPVPTKQKKFVGYYKLARHYKWALNQTFFRMGYKTAIITEDDLDISTDFFEYFMATYPLLRLDPTLWCVSAWNDNGKADKIKMDPKLLYRTDFFPGLGWMLRRELWEELVSSWPSAFWDDWMRKTEQRQNRACIRPEVSRTSMSRDGKVGVSKGLFYEKHLKHIVLNSEFVNFTSLDLSYLLKENYDQRFVEAVYNSPSITQTELNSQKLNTGVQPFPASIRLTYDNKNTYKVTAKTYGLMDDFRAGVPRTAYRGVVPFVHKGVRVYLAPTADWNGYDATWT